MQASTPLSAPGGAWTQRLWFLNSSIFSRPFQERTCLYLITKFGGTANPGGSLTFEQFCMVMEFLKEIKELFSGADVDKDGSLSATELSRIFALRGLPMQQRDIAFLGQRFDSDQSG